MKIMQTLLYISTFVYCTSWCADQSQKTVSLVDLIPVAAQTPFKNIMLSDLYLKAVPSSTMLPAHIELAGTIDVSPLNLPGMNKQVAKKLVCAAAIFTKVQSRSLASLQSQPSTVSPAPTPSPRPQQQQKQPAAPERRSADGYLRNSQGQIYVKSGGKVFTFNEKITNTFTPEGLEKVVNIPEVQQALINKKPLSSVTPQLIKEGKITTADFKNINKLPESSQQAAKIIDPEVGSYFLRELDPRFAPPSLDKELQGGHKVTTIKGNIYVETQNGRKFIFSSEAGTMTPEQLQQFAEKLASKTSEPVSTQTPRSTQPLTPEDTQAAEEARMKEFEETFQKLQLPDVSENPPVTPKSQQIEPEPEKAPVTGKTLSEEVEPHPLASKSDLLPQEEAQALQSVQKKLTQPSSNKLGFGTGSPIGGALFTIQLNIDDYKPFASQNIISLDAIDAQTIKKISLKNAELGLYLAPSMGSMFADAQANVINLPLLVRVLFNLEPDNTGVILQAGLPETWKPSDSFAQLKVLDFLEIKKAYVYLSTIRYIDYSIATNIIPGAGASASVSGRPSIGIVPGIEIRPGISLYGELNLKKLLPFLKKFEGLNTISLYGTISYNPQNILLGAGLPDFIKLSGNGPFKSAGTWLEVRGTSPGGSSGGIPDVALVIAMTFKPSSQDDPLVFTMRGSVNEQEAKFALTLRGFWENALGIKGLAIGDVAIQVNANYEQLAESGLPSALGLTGSIELGKQGTPQAKKMTVAAFVDSQNSKDDVLQGKFDGTLSLVEIINTAESMAIRALKTTKTRGAQKSAVEIHRLFETIMNNPISKKILDLSLENVEVTIAPQTVRIGEITIMQGFVMKGETTVLGVKAGLNMGISQIGFISEGYLSPIKLGNFFKLAASPNDKTGNEGAKISCALNFNAQHFIISGLIEFLGIRQDTLISLDKDGFKTDIEGKLANLFDARITIFTRGGIKKPDIGYKGFLKNDFYNVINAQVQQELSSRVKETTGKIDQSTSNLDSLRAQIKDFDRQIADKQKQLDKLKGDFASEIKNSPEIIKLGTEIGGLEIAKGTVVATLKTAEGSITAGRAVVQGTSAAAEEILALPKQLFNITSVMIQGDFQDIIQGKLPLLKVTFTLFGKEHTLDVGFDFSSKESAQRSAQTLAQEIIKVFGR